MNIKDKKILIIFGGLSNEREVSIVSGKAVYEALDKEGYNVEFYDFCQPLSAFVNYVETLDKSNTIIFNALHGKFGEDGKIQAVLDFLKIPYTHSGVLTSAVSMDKNVTKILAKSIGIRVPNGVIITNKLEDIDCSLKDLEFPLVVKPNSDGSSVGLYIVDNLQELKNSISKISSTDGILIEEYIKGTECTVGVLNSSALTVTEIVPKSEFYDFKSKYIPGMSEHIIPARLNEDVLNLMKVQSEQMFDLLGATGVVRVDFLVKNNIPYLLEVNNQPGFTPTSLLPEQAAFNGMSFVELCVNLINTAQFRVH